MKKESRPRPSRVLRLVLHLPIYLFRARMSWLLADRFLLLTHQGRKSGMSRQTALEVLHHDREHGTYYVYSGWGVRSDWARNVEKTPVVTITVGTHSCVARAHRLSPSRAKQIIGDYAHMHPLAFRVLCRLLGYGVGIPGAERVCALVQQGAVFSLQREKSEERGGV